MNQLNLNTRIQILKLMVEGCSLRSISRLTNCSINTVAKFQMEIGKACEKFHHENVKGIKVNRVQADEIWAFVGCKAKNVPHTQITDGGDIWTWTAMDTESKLLISWMQGKRDSETCQKFMDDLYYRIINRIQLTSDGFSAYLEPVTNTFMGDIDFAQLEKQYGTPIKNGKVDKRRQYIGSLKTVIIGDPDSKHISTSYVERQNLTMRMHMRRYTRKTNAFSKKLENHKLATALHFVFYNFVRKHSTLKATPAMRAGIMDRPLTFGEIIKFSEELKRVEKYGD